MANNSRRRLSFVDLAHPQVWNKLIEYTQVTLTLTELITDFTDQWAKICVLASNQLRQLVDDFRKRSDIEIRGKCHLGGMMYDLWESLLLESEIESQSLKKVAHVMENDICEILKNFKIMKNFQLNIYQEHHQDLDEILEESHKIVREVHNEDSKIYDNQGVSPDYHCAHNQYILELVGINHLYSKYQHCILPQLIQGMEQSQLETIDIICQKIQLIASVLQQYHEQRQSSFASFVVTSTGTNPNEELENYICSMNQSSSSSHGQIQSIPPTLNQSLTTSNNEQLIIYTAPVIQMQLASRCKETLDRLKEIKKEKASLSAGINSQTPRIPIKQRNDQQQSDRKTFNQMSDLLKRKHQLRLIEMEESVLLAQQDLLKSHRPTNSTMAEHEHHTSKRTTKNIRGLWRDAFRALKASTTTSGTSDDESHSSFARRISSRKKKRGSEREREEAQPVIDPVYETLKIAAETRKRAVALYLQQRQQSLNKQTSLNSQGSSELDIQPSPRVIRHNDSTTSTQPQTPSLLPGKRNSAVQFSPVVDKSPYSMRRSK